MISGPRIYIQAGNVSQAAVGADWIATRDERSHSHAGRISRLDTRFWHCIGYWVDVFFVDPNLKLLRAFTSRNQGSFINAQCWSLSTKPRVTSTDQEIYIFHCDSIFVLIPTRFVIRMENRVENSWKGVCFIGVHLFVVNYWSRDICCGTVIWPRPWNRKQ